MAASTAEARVPKHATFDAPLGLAPGLDVGLLAATTILLSIGVLLVYSSSSVFAASEFGDATLFLKRQLGGCAVGLVALVWALRTPTDFFARRAGWFFLVSVALCMLVLIPGLGVKVGGARRWLDVMGFRFQPSEFAKLAVVMLTAVALWRRERKPKAERPSLLIPVLVAQISVLLILAEPDLGTALEIELILVAMVFVAGVRVRTLVLLTLAAMPLFYHLVVGTPFRLRRLLGYIDPWAYRSTVGYQVTEALISIGSGGVFGVGLGDSKQKLFFLPEAHTDFIFAILAEELGLIGVTVVLVTFAVLVVQGGRIALSATDGFDRYLALGLTALVGVPAVFNVCVVTGLLPTKGLPLPLLSYGRSNLVMTLLAIGLLLRIALQSHRAREAGEPS